MTFASEFPLKKLTGSLALSFVIIGICVFGLMTYVSHSPRFDSSLRANILKAVIYDDSGDVLCEGDAGILEHLPKNGKTLSLEVSNPVGGRASKVLYLTPMQSPLRVQIRGSVIFADGDFDNNIPPKSLDILFPLEMLGNNSSMTIETRLYSLSGSHLLFIKRSGFGNRADLTLTKFFNTFLTSTGNFTLSAIFIALSVILLISCLNLGWNLQQLSLAVASVCQAWIALWFSREAYGILINVANMHRISFVIYFLFFSAYAVFLKTSSSKPLRRLYDFFGVVGLIAAAILLGCGLTMSLPETFQVYKYALAIALIGYFVFAIGTTLAVLKIKQNPEPIVFHSLFPVAAWLIALGHGNDILRVYSHAISPYNLGPYSFFLALVLYLVGITYYIYAHHQQVMANEKEYSKLAAIGQTTSMLAHDVRKPFTQLKSVLAMLDAIKDNPSELARAKTGIDQSIRHVEKMISDIMDFSREVSLDAKPVSLINLLDFSVRQSAQNHRNSNVSFSYKLRHKSKILADEERLSRAFSNIIDNAIEAITVIGRKDSGSVTIGAVDVVKDGLNYVEVVIGNDGPPVNESDIPKIFESFFTKGKQKGTGLGLASAKKIVNLHNGFISARNMENGRGVEFIVQIPASGEPDAADKSALPKNVVVPDFRAVASEESDIANSIKTLHDSGLTIKILLLEDEPLYRASVRNTIKSSEELHRLVVLYDAKTVDDAMKLVECEGITHAIVDIDLDDAKNGFDFLRQASEKFPGLNSMVHSNRCGAEDNEKAKALGAKAFVPKPLNIEQLLAFLVGTLPARKPNASTEKTPQRIVLVCDDDALARKYAEFTLKKIVPDARIHIFPNAETLLEKLKGLSANKSVPPAAYTVFTDQNMGAMSGLELAGEIRRLNIPCKIFMVSNERKSEFEPKALAAGTDAYFEGSLSAEILASVFK